jgi:hypothetical protein
MPDRCGAHGSVPYAGLAHAAPPAPTGAAAACDGAKRARKVWMMCGMGARGLLYHALLAKWLAAAADAHDASLLPPEVRRAEFGEMLSARLERVAAARRAEAEAEARSAQRAAPRAAVGRDAGRAAERPTETLDLVVGVV